MTAFRAHFQAWRWAVTIALLIVVTIPACFPQAPSNEKPARPAAQPSDNSGITAATDTNPQSVEKGMPAEQLIDVLQKNPEVMVEVKSLIADEAQQQGVSLQPEALTDQQVYSQLETSAKLRASVTEFLRARGYISEAEIEDARAKYPSAPLELEEEVPSRLDLRDDSNISGAKGQLRDPNLDPDALEVRTRSSRTRAASMQTPSQSRENDTLPNVTDEPSALHSPAPYNLRALRDLYTQVPDSQQRLKRFGSDLFTVRNLPQTAKREGGLDGMAPSLDVPPGPDYVLGSGDQLSIVLWGGASQTILRIVDRDGRVSLPEAGPVQVGGMTLEKAQLLIADAMQQQFRNAHVFVTVTQVRSIRIFVVGDAQRPGAYEISALGSPLSALFAAGGPNAIGSLRVLRHFRNERSIGEIDLYDFMLHGVRPLDDRLEAGDTLLVPPVGSQVAVFGAVKRPGIYELKDEKSLAEVLKDAGGLTVAASLTHISIERVVANEHREEVAVIAGADDDREATLSRLRSIEVRDGDRIHVAPVLPYSEKVVYLQGHIARPGKFPYREGMHINDILRSYQDLLPEPADRGEIVHLVPPDLHPETIEFRVPDVLIGNSNIELHPFDTIRIFGRYELDAPTVSVRGEVQRPGTYPMFEGMTAAELVRTAGGFKRDALVKLADLASYQVENGARVAPQRQDVAIGDAVLRNDRGADVALKPGDVLTVHQLTGWDDIGASIIIEGEIAHPGSYSFQPGEHLSDVLRRAGGFRTTAYPQGAVLTRPEVASLEEKTRQELIRQIEAGAASARMAQSASGDPATLQLAQQQQEQVLTQLRTRPSSGRLVIHIDSDIDSWAATAADIEVRSGDTLRIPKRPGFVLVSGQVYNPAAITFMPGHTAGWYLERAGGATSVANRKGIFIVRANGSVIGRGEQGPFQHSVLSTRLEAGDTVVVPQKILGPSVTWRNLLATAQVVTSMALSAAVVAGL